MKKERIVVEERMNDILEILRKNPEKNVADLSLMLNVSKVTIRRDLQYLEDHKKVSRFYGGAKVLEAAKSEGLMEAEEIKLYRDLIARYAASLVEDGDSIFVNTSSNALQMLDYVKCKNVTVVTNNGGVIGKDYQNGLNIFLSGGEVRYPKNALVGDFAIRNLQTIFPKKAFVGCSGISALSGLTTEIMGEVEINALMLKNATKAVYVLADHTKIGKNSSFTTATIEKVGHLITDEKAPENLLDELRQAGVEIHLVGKNDLK